MNRRSAFKRAGMVGILAAGIAPAVHAQGAIRWRLTSSFPRQLDAMYGAGDAFAQKVGQLSGGRFTVTVHPPGELVAPFGVVDAVQQGTVECGHTNPQYYFGKDETFAIAGGIPFGLNSRQMATWYADGKGQKLLGEFHANYNIVHFPCGHTGAQMLTWFRNDPTSLEDFKGLKFRIGGVSGMVLRRVGVEVSAVSAGGLVRALANGEIDAAEWVGPYDDQRLGLGMAAPFCSYAGWREGGTQLAVYVNAKAYGSLNEEMKAIVQAASAHAHSQMLAKYDSRNVTAFKELVGGGAQLRKLSEPLVEETYRQALGLYDEISAKNANWKTIYADYAQFRRDQNLWGYFSEGTFDRFMHLQKR